jgi:DNA repair protein RecO (recombination protein O)
MNSRKEGFVIYKQKVRDSVWIVKIFTKEQGLQSFWLRPKKEWRSLNAMDEINFDSKGDQRDQLHWIKDLEWVNPHHHIHAHPYRAATALFIQEVLYRLLQENDANPPLFFFIQEILQQLDADADISLLHFAFLLGLMRSMGCCPSAPQHPVDWFGLEAGVFGNGAPPRYAIENAEGQLSCFIALLEGRWEQLNKPEVRNGDRRKLLKSLVDYLFIHQHKINSINSLEIYYELFHA